MIVGFFLSLLFIGLSYIVGLLPSWPFPVEITNGWNMVWGLMNSVNFLFPVKQLAVAMIVYVLIIKTRFGVAIVRKIISAIRGVHL